MGLQRQSGSGEKKCYELSLEELNRKWAVMKVRFSATHYPFFGYVVYCHPLRERTQMPAGLSFMFDAIRSKTVRGVRQAVALRMRKLCDYEEV
jgi:hypothetical protein